MGDIQKDADVNQAKARLEEVDRRKNETGGPVPTGMINRQTGEIRKPEGKNIRPVTGKPKKQSFGKKLKEAFFGDIGDGSITEHIFFKIFVPTFKRVLSDMANTAISMALGLDPKPRTYNANTHVANARIYRDRNYSRTASERPGYMRREAACDYVWDEETAKDIYTQINDILERYPAITLAEVYSIMNMPEKIRSTDSSWGWTSMRDIELYEVGDNEWVVSLPPVREL